MGTDGRSGDRRTGGRLAGDWRSSYPSGAAGLARTYLVYILASDSRELYVGVTGNLARRISQHRGAIRPEGFTAKHATTRLVFCETTDNVLAAILREKQLKGWTRQRKLELIEGLNPDWKDLAEGWCEEWASAPSLRSG